MDLADTGKVLTRLGTILAQAGSYHSLWADGDRCYVMTGQDMKQVSPSYSLTQVIRLTTARRSRSPRTPPAPARCFAG